MIHPVVKMPCYARVVQCVSYTHSVHLKTETHRTCNLRPGGHGNACMGCMTERPMVSTRSMDWKHPRPLGWHLHISCHL